MKRAIVILLLCLVGMAGDYLWPFIGQDFWYISVRVFQLLAITLCWQVVANNVLKKAVEFTWGFAFYGVIKELLLNPLDIEPLEYAGLFLGLLVLLVQIVRGK